MKNIVLIETDNSFIHLFKAILKQHDLAADYVVNVIDPSKDITQNEDCIDKAVSLFHTFKASHSIVDLVLVDIEIFSDLSDTYGIEISKKLKLTYPNTPVLNITYHFDEFSLPKIFSDAVLSINDGVLPKSFFTKSFSRDRFKNMFGLLQDKLKQRAFVSEGKKEDVYQSDYAIITALYEDEFEQIKNCFNDSTLTKILVGKRYYYRWEVEIDGITRVVVGAYQSITGMVDASILTSEMILLFKPKYLIMTGVCGGKDDEKINFGDVVIASKVYVFQKGKMNGGFDKEGIEWEKFEQELEEINLSDDVSRLRPHVKEIQNEIVQNYTKKKAQLGEKANLKLNVFIEPIACSLSVINKDGYFENLTAIDRKTLAVEMESYGVARACRMINDGKTVPIIIKSVMDKTKEKNDNAKPFAAYTSAQFVNQLILKDLLFK